jgi:hypothetical protein
LDGERVSTVTTHGDIYSYGSVVLQVCKFEKLLLLILTFELTSGTVWKTTLSPPSQG